MHLFKYRAVPGRCELCGFSGLGGDDLETSAEALTGSFGASA